MTSLFQHCLDFLMPPRCLMCGIIVTDAGRVCVECFKQLDFIAKPHCDLCARPFISDAEAGQDFICSDCYDLNVPWQHCRAAFLYNDGFKKLIMPLKYGDQQNSIGFLAHFMYRSAQDLVSCADYIIPVPLHKQRLRYRKYNQSALLAWKLGVIAKKSVLPVGLSRIKATEVLGHLSKQERQLLLKKAFAVPVKSQNKLAQKRVVLIDDVMTTGSTLSECALTLLQEGVRHVDILAAAKVL